MMLGGLSLVRLAAMSICAPYGMMPCMKHEKVSRMLAALRLSTPYLSLILLAIPPTVIIATVLLAVQMSIAETIRPITASAPRRPCMWIVILSMI